MILIDTHAHLQNPAFAGDLDAILERAAQAGIHACLVPGSTLLDSRAAVALAERFAGGPCSLYAAVGIHPTDVNASFEVDLSELRDLAQHPRVVAIGEIGLDYYWPQQSHRAWPCPDPPLQRCALEKQLALAAELRLPVIIHDRDAHADMFAMLADWIQGEATRTGTLHAYAAGPSRLHEALDLGFYIGMDGPLTYHKATDLHEVARQVPLERYLIETDSPYLPPHPYRGRRNEPAHLPLIVERLAELRQLAPEIIAGISTQNASRLFGLDTPTTR